MGVYAWMSGTEDAEGLSLIHTCKGPLASIPMGFITGNHLVTSLPRPLALQHAVASQSAVPLGLGPLANTFSSLLDSSSCSPFAP